MSRKYVIYKAGNKKQMAVCSEIEAAAALCVLYGFGTTIKFCGRVVWKEGHEKICAKDSYGQVAIVVWHRIDAHNHESYDKSYGAGSYAALLAKVDARHALETSS